MSESFSEGLSEEFHRVKFHGASVEFKGESMWISGFERFQSVSVYFRGYQ